MARKKFLRRNHDKYSRLGRKKLLKWRRPRGRHGKMREERKGYPSVPKIGLKKRNQRLIKLVRDMRDLMNLKRNEQVILARLGKKKRQQMEDKAGELGIKILNKRQNKAGK